MVTTVVNLNTNGGSCDIYIGRPSKWGNPFKIGVHGTREEVLRKYKIWLTDFNTKSPARDIVLRSLPELKDKVLGCYCAPLSCHGDVLAELVNNNGFGSVAQLAEQ